MTVSVYLPDSEPGPISTSLASSPASLKGLRIAVLDNGKPNADVVMIHAAEALAAAVARPSAFTAKSVAVSPRLSDLA
jgi:hypothetical protein